MAKQKKVYMPLSYGGLIRYPEEGKEKIRLKPKDLIWITILIIAFELFLRLIF